MLLAALNKIYEQEAIFILLDIPDNLLYKIQNKSRFEENIINRGNRFTYYFDGKHNDELQQLYPEYEEDEIIHVHNYRLSKFATYYRNGIRLLTDIRSKYYNVINRCRIVVNKPDKFNRNIYVFGNCIGVGAFAEDKYTFSSLLQKKLNIDYNNIAVQNAANWGDMEESCRQIVSPTYKLNKGDVIILITHNAPSLDAINKIVANFDDNSFFHRIDMSDQFERPHKYGEIFIDKYHMNHHGYQLITDNVYQSIKNIIDNIAIKSESVILKQIKRYFVENNLVRTNYKKIGAIVMNCNPFTNGHRYLINEALKYVEYLYIFIVSEDKSFFSFKDRFEIIHKNIRNINNCKIVPSGSFMISRATLPEYFEKEKIQNVNIDCSVDVEIFCKYIAPELGITHRFVGSEPLCKITNQYNMCMHNILPKYGITLIEIERYMINNQTISASLVRNLIKSNNYNELKKYISDETFAYCLEKGLIDIMIQNANQSNVRIHSGYKADHLL